MLVFRAFLFKLEYTTSLNKQENCREIENCPLKKFIKLLIAFFLVFTLLVGMAAIALYIATPILGKKKAEIEQFASHMLHQPVKIEASEGIWLKAHPGILLKNVTIFDEKGLQPQLKIAEIKVGFKILKSLWQKKPVLGNLSIDGAHVNIHQAINNHITIIGLSNFTQEDAAPFNATSVLQWATSMNTLKLNHISIDWQKPDGHWVKIPYAKLMIQNSWYDSKGILNIKQTEIGELLKDFSLKGWQLVNGKINALNLRWIFRYQTLNYLKGSVNINHLNLIQPNRTPWQINSLISRFLWRGKISDQWSLKLQELSFNLDGKNWVEKMLNLNVLPLKKGGTLYSVHASQLHLSNFWSILTKLQLLSPNQPNLVTHLNPKGDLKNIYFEYPSLYSQNLIDSGHNKPTPATLETNSALHWKLSAEVHNLSTSPWNKVPGVSQLTGYLQASNNMGQFRLDSEKLKLTFLTLFRTPMFFEHAQANIDWHILPTGYKINVSNVDADNMDVKFKGDMSLWIPNNAKSPFMHLFGEFKVNPDAKISPYLPVAIMKPNLIKWFDLAFLSVGGANGTLVLHGPLDKFPFPHQEGTLAIHTQFSEIAFRYFANWPVMTHLFGKLNFDGPKMNLVIDSGKVFDTQIKSAYVEIPVLLKEVDANLHASANLAGDLRDVTRFIQKSPLDKKLGGKIGLIKLDGDSEINFKLDIPLEKDNAPIQVKGTIDMAEATASLPFKKLTFENITGLFHFTQNSIRANHIQAEFLHSPVSLNIETSKNAQLFKLNGKAGFKDIRKAFNLPALPSITGNLTYQAKLILAHDTKLDSHRLSITSDLKGIKVDLPAPFKKTSDTPAYSQINITFDDPMNVQFNFNNLLKGILNYDSEDFAFKKGNIVVGSGEATLPNEENGLWVTGALPAFHWESWKSLLQSSPQKEQKTVASSWPVFLKQISLSFDTMRLFDQTFQPALLKLSRDVDRSLISIQSPTAIGNVSIPDNEEGIWKAHFQKLYLSKNVDTKKPNLKTSDIPPLDIFVHDFRYARALFGQTRLILKPTETGLSITQLSTESPAFSLSAQGKWQSFSNRDYTHLVGKMNIHNIGETFARFSMPESIVGKDGKLSFNLEWPAPPYEPAVKLLSGRIDITLNNGHIINLSEEATRKIGLGQLLTFFSLQNLQKHLMLDFSDLSNQGFPFNTMQGSFVLKRGEAYTKDTYCDSAVAYIAMRGDISLANESYDVYFDVTPHVTSSLPIVATIAGGPVVGLTTWVADKLLSKQVAKLMTYSYRMRGPWSNPQISKVAT